MATCCHGLPRPTRAAASTGFRIARSGPRLDWLTEFAARLVELLTERP
jgi:hypothetical protein